MQELNPLVTVGIPTYNRPQGLARTLECICNQTYSNLQIIVSDNCSDNPEVADILKEFTGKDQRVSCYIQKINISIVPNFQYLLDNASGKYFMWAADDDQWDNNFIETCVTAMEVDDEVVLSMTNIKIIREDGSIKPGDLNLSFMQHSIFTRSFNYVKCAMVNKYFLCGLYRTSIVRDVPFHNSWGGEHLFLYEIITKGKFLHIQGESNFHYYQGGSSKSTDSIRKAFNIKSRFYFFDAYVLKYITYQFGFKHLTLAKKLGLFFTNGMALLFNEEYILYYILIKKPVKAIFKKLKRKTIEHNS